ncbi:type II toxin-antitoxin system VapC family toxin [Candidatus Poribacteria bacterium]|nr:type II toxin-antitoxin system VapC family toxin [Candidatus Poribacteria bacterium]
MKSIVIDASVALKWYLSDEEHGAKALDILESHVTERISLHAPALLEFEVANGLAIAKRRARVGDNDVLKAIEGFVALGIALHPLSPLFQKVLDYTERLNISAYDAAYVALAEALQIQLVTADKRLFDSARKLNFIKWIGQFRV